MLLFLRMIASVLVQNGKLLRGDSIVAGNAFAKVSEEFMILLHVCDFPVNYARR